MRFQSLSVRCNLSSLLSCSMSSSGSGSSGGGGGPGSVSRSGSHMPVVEKVAKRAAYCHANGRLESLAGQASA